jgi:hypothetical protein
VQEVAQSQGRPSIGAVGVASVERKLAGEASVATPMGGEEEVDWAWSGRPKAARPIRQRVQIQNFLMGLPFSFQG